MSPLSSSHAQKVVNSVARDSDPDTAHKVARDSNPDTAVILRIKSL